MIFEKFLGGLQTGSTRFVFWWAANRYRGASILLALPISGWISWAVSTGLLAVVQAS